MKIIMGRPHEWKIPLNCNEYSLDIVGLSFSISIDRTPRPLLTIEEVPESDRYQFRYAFECGDTERQFHRRIFELNGDYMDLYDMPLVVANILFAPLAGWERYLPDGYSSGLVVKESDHKDCVIVGTYKAKE